MSTINFYLEKGYTPVNKTVNISGLNTIAVWTPSTSTKIVVTDVSLSNINAGTIAFYWGNLAGSKIAEFCLAGSATVSPIIGNWECTAYDRILHAVLGGASGTDDMRVNLTGFEIPQW